MDELGVAEAPVPGLPGAHRTRTFVLGRSVLEAVAKTSPSETVLVFVRHSEKERVGPDPARLLTARGHIAAHRFGESLPAGRPLRVYHSPAERCHQTAEDLLEGYLHATPAADADIEASDGRLASWETAVVDRAARRRLREELGGQRALVWAWLEGKVSRDVILPADEVTHELFSWALRQARPSPAGTLHVFVSHDFSMLGLGRFVLGIRERAELPWPNYLDGPVFTRAAGGPLAAQWRGECVAIDIERWKK